MCTLTAQSGQRELSHHDENEMYHASCHDDKFPDQATAKIPARPGEPCDRANNGTIPQGGAALSAFGFWLLERRAAGEPALTTLKVLGAGAAILDGMEEDTACKRLDAFALHPQACEIIRKMCASRPPFPFSVWLSERETNGATAEQILRVLGLEPGEGDSCMASDAQRWAGLKKLAEEQHAWEILASMSRPVKLSEAPPRQAIEVIDGVPEVAHLIAQSSSILVLVGAGISASCGIPTFRDSNGFYDSIAKEYGLDSPEEISDINFFKRCPDPWFKKVKAIVPTKSAPRRPSLTHRFLRVLQDQGKLLHLFTQNIDTLETMAGITNVTFCHGSFGSATCMGCRRSVDGESTNETIHAGSIPRCTACGAVVKPDVVLFNEPMPEGVHDLILEHTENADLLLVLGTSLNVRPCSLIPSLVGASGNAPRVLINQELAGKLTDFEGFLQGPCDAIVEDIMHRLAYNVDVDDVNMKDMQNGDVCHSR